MFQLTHRPEQEAAAAMCGMEDTAEARATFYRIGVGEKTDQVRKGHCVMRDPSGRAATVQLLIPDDHVAELLNTTPDTAAAPSGPGRDEDHQEEVA